MPSKVTKVTKGKQISQPQAFQAGSTSNTDSLLSTGGHDCVTFLVICISFVTLTFQRIGLGFGGLPSPSVCTMYV